MSSTVLVIAATGKTGTPLVEQLLSRGATVRGGTTRPETATMPAGAQVAHFDWSNRSTWAAATEGVDAVYLVTPDIMTTYDDHVAPYIDVMKTAGVRRTVALTAAGVEHAPPEVHLRAVELGLSKAGFEFAGVLRPSWFQQNFGEGIFVDDIRDHGEVRASAGQGKVPFVDTRDIAAVAVAMLLGDTDETAATITGPAALTFADAAEALARGADRKITYVDKEWDHYRDELADKLGGEYADIMGTLFAMIRAGQVPLVTDDVQRITGRAPSSLEAYARQFKAELGG